MNSGRRANRTGRRLESFVQDSLEELGYIEKSPQDFFELRRLKQPIYARQCEIGLDIYSKRRRVDFIFYHPAKWDSCLVLQCKWQASRGSVEEKYPFEVLSIQLNNFNTIIIIDGGGYSQGALQWLTSQAGKNKLLHVFDQGDFQRFITRGQL